MTTWPGVSVVVPSAGRPELLHAVAGVQAQDYPGEVETVVVLDGGGDHAGLVARLSAAGVVVHETGRPAGANAARNLGARAASGELVAYLDDDDLWEPDKLRAQVDLLRRLGPEGPTVVSCRVRFRRPGRSERSRPVPDRLPSPRERVEDYLFRRRRPTLGRAVVQTSTLLLPRELALAVPWDEGLVRHQDWDWLTRAQDEASARLAMCPAPLVVCATGSADSISARPDWRASLAWGLSRGAGWAPTTLADFLVGQPLRYALQARSAVGVVQVLAAVAATGRPPAPSPVLISLGGLLPRRAFEAAALRSGRRRRGPEDLCRDAQDRARRRVSVVMAVHDPGEGVLAALGRLRRTLGDDDELVVADDGSTDGTSETARAWLREHWHPSGAWQVLSLAGHRGVAPARNAALRHTSGELVWFVDWDDTWDPAILDRLATALDATGATVAVCGADHVDAHGVRLRRLGARFRRPVVLEGPQIGLAVLDGDLQGYLWNKLFAREVLGENPFPEQRSQSDFAGTAAQVAAQRRVVVLPDVLYAHVRRPGSVTNTTYPSMAPLDRSLEVAAGVADRLAAAAPSAAARRRVSRALRGFRYREHHLTVANTALRLSDDDDYRRAMLARALDGMRWSEVAALAAGSPVLAARAALLLAAGGRYPHVYDAYVDLRRRTYRWRRPRHTPARDGLR